MTEKHSPPKSRWFSPWLGKQTAQVAENEVIQMQVVTTEIAAEEGVTVCYCFNVDEESIKSAIKKHKLCSVEAVGLCLEAGTHCGSCHSRIQALLD
ncbi:(2Fe-2S)-binding protein [Methylomonas sp. AM2-LC]|uniref:(2Fe-2S)-binding protein n=1 Tax=Methylomonas sp. AM2-LC TaxID=3153301 RepID=UPI003267D14B